MAETPKAPNVPSSAYLLDPSGETVRVPIDQAQQLLELGWAPATTEQAAQYKLDEKFSTPGQQAITAAEGAADALTLGASTYAEKALGVPTEDIANRERVNPTARTAGQLFGIAAPIALTAGAAALPAGAKGAASLTAPALISRAGAGTASAVEALLPAATSTLGKVGVAAAKAGAAGAVEGGLFGVGNVVHESALGDPNLTAQSALEEIGISALLGGGLGAVGGAGTEALSALASKASGSKLGQKISEWLPEFEGERNIKAAGAIQSDITQASKRVSREELNKIGREAGEMGLVTPFSTPAKTLEKSHALMESAGSKMDDILLSADGVAKPRSMREVADRVRRELVERFEKNPLEKGTAKALGELMEDYAKLYTDESNPLTFRALHDVRKQVSDKIYGLRGTADPQATALKDALHDFRTILSDEINAGLDAAKLGSGAWKAANREYQVGATMAKFAEKGIQRSVGNNLVSPMEMLSGVGGLISGGIPASALAGLGTAAARRFGSGIMGAGARALRGFLDGGGAAQVVGKTAQAIEEGALSGEAAQLLETATAMPEGIAALSQLQRANQVVAKRIDDMAARIFEGGRAASRAATGAIGAGLASASSAEERIARLQRVARNPEVLNNALATQAEGLGEHAPSVSMAMQVSSARAVGFLAAKLPELPPETPLGGKAQLPKQQAWAFNRYYDAVDDPTSVLEHAAQGTLTPMDVEAVQTVYPELFARMTSAVLDKLTSKKGQVPYSQRLMLSMLLGQDVDGTMTPEAIRSAQAIYMLPSRKADAQGPAGMARPSKTGMSKLNASGRSMTSTQATDVRMSGGG